jgi:hypothetical protein
MRSASGLPKQIMKGWPRTQRWLAGSARLLSGGGKALGVPLSPFWNAA